MPHIYGHAAPSTSTSDNTANVTVDQTGVGTPTQQPLQAQLPPPPGFHYMPDGSLMSDAEHARLYGSHMDSMVIKYFDLDFSNLASEGEQRNFSIIGDNNSEFILEVKDNTTSHYYNFATNTFQAAQAKLEAIVTSGVYNGYINFPAVTGSDDKYDVYLYAKPGTMHNMYNEVRFGDGSIDINSSTGSNSLMMQKVIYQYTAVTLSLQGYSPSSSVNGNFTTKTISVDKYKSKNKQQFSLKLLANAAESYKILKQPSTQDILSYLSLTVGSDPELLPGENEYPTATAAFTGDDVNGAVTSGSVVRMDNTDLSEVINIGDKITSPVTTGTINGGLEGETVVTLDEDAAGLMAVGDVVGGAGCPFCEANPGFDACLVTVVGTGGNAKRFTIANATDFIDDGELTFSSKVNISHTTVTVVETSGTATDFTMSQAIQFRDNQPLTFTPRKNKRWPLDNINGLTIGSKIIKETTDINVTTDSFISEYENTTTINEGYYNEEIIVKDSAPALDTKGQLPTIVDGFVTVQPGSVVFNNQQVLALGGDTIKIAGYGTGKISSVYGYELLITDLSISLGQITTTTTSAVSNSTTIPVASVNGVLPSTTTVSGIGIDPLVADPTVNSRSVTSGPGNLELNVAQTLEDGVTLTYANAGQVATITGNVEVLSAGADSQTIYFDVETLLSSS